MTQPLRPEPFGDPADVVVRISPVLDSDALNLLFAAAWPEHRARDWGPVLRRSLAWVGAFGGGRWWASSTWPGTAASTPSCSTPPSTRSSSGAASARGLSGRRPRRPRRAGWSGSTWTSSRTWRGSTAPAASPTPAPDCSGSTRVRVRDSLHTLGRRIACVNCLSGLK